MLETAAIIDEDDTVLYWHLPAKRSSVSIPDSHLFWEILRRNRDRIVGVAHSHPGIGPPIPSFEDLSTFSAIELALGKSFLWWITSGDCLIVYTMATLGVAPLLSQIITKEPPWTDQLIKLSGYESLEEYYDQEGESK